MDQILLGILKSDKDPRIKSTIVKKIKTSGRNPNSESVVLGILNITSNYMLESPSKFDQGACQDVFDTWASYNVNYLSLFCHEQYVCRLLMETFPNGSNVSWLLQKCMNCLWKGGQAAHFNSVCDLVRLRAVRYVKERTDDCDCLEVAAFCETLLLFKQCIPQGEEQPLLCVSVINAVAAARKPPDQRHAVLLYLHRVNRQMGQLLNYLWMQGDPRCIDLSLLNIFRIIAYVDPSRQVTPSMALAGVVQFLPTSVIDKVSKDTVHNSAINDANLLEAIHRMILWLCWPETRNIDRWVLAFLEGLVTSHKYTLFIQVVESSIEQMFDRLLYEKIRGSCFNVLEYMLLTFRHSPEPFHKVIGKVPALEFQLKKERNSPFMEKVANLLACLMHLHPGFPDLYETLLDDLKEYRLPTQEQIVRRVGQSGRGSQLQATPTHTSYVHKSETGKAGLINMGNTCFMNTVVQALYMCDRFRRRVFSHIPNINEPLMSKLQILFAYLKLTERPALAPETFLAASRPAWFSVGSQQDSSEYLRYLLDQLHEQEMSSHKKHLPHPSGKMMKKTSPTKSPEVSIHGSAAAEVKTLIEDAFGGSLLNTYKCLKCRNESHHKEQFSDIPLAFPIKDDKEKKIIGKKNSDSTINLEDLVGNYLRVEHMMGDNCYECKHCGGLQEAERHVNITHSPNYLILSLLRFSYNVKHNSRSKILTEVKYPRVLQLPVNSGRNAKDTIHGKDKVRQDTYALVTVIVHSGLSSDHGHYYCYARHSNPEPLQQKNGLPQDYLQDQWFLFNDSRITFSNFQAFSSVSKKFSKDTPYMLVYKKMYEGVRAMDDIEMSLDETTDAPVKTDLWQKVESDNRNFAQEIEQQRRRKEELWQGSPSNNSWYKRDDDPPDSCGGGGRGGFTEGARLVF